MRQLLFALSTSVLLVASAAAQGTGPEGPPDQGGMMPDGPGPGGPGPGPDSDARSARRNQMKALFADCRSQAQGQGLRGRPMRQAMSDCIVKQRPEMAGRMKCRTEGMDKGLRKDDLKSYIRSCTQQGGR